ncbi:myelin-associated glycoprotein-like [Heterodontus francisci]|uniref:myelin-associated glycoprotein-like n=1 Tax=Heterodontus francisci TaxID=7792 RepID=UPI00355BF0E5
MKIVKFLSAILLFSEVVQNSRWAVKIPGKVSALKGSCVEISCTFNHPANGHSPQIRWLKGSPEPGIIVYDSRNADIVDTKYKGRTELTGDLSKKQCSLLINDIRKSDEGDYYLALSLTNSQNTTDRYTASTPVSLSIPDKPWISVSGKFIAGQPAHVTCSVNYSCPSANFKLMWIPEESLSFLPATGTSEQTTNSFDGSRTRSSTVTFIPLLGDHGKRLGCKLLTAGGLGTVGGTLRLDVQYKPTIVSGPTCHSSKNGVSCTCSVRANPPANITWNLNGRNITGNSSNVEFLSWRETSHLLQSSLNLTQPNGSGNLISCIAANEHGVSDSECQLHPPDKPTIVSGPTCHSSKSGVSCTCSVRANPPANITWNLNGRNITGNSSNVEFLSWRETSHLLQSSLNLTQPNGSGNLISCIAANEHGVSDSECQLHPPGTFPWTIVLSVVTVTVVIILILIAVKVHRKRRRDITCVPATNSDSVTYAVVQQALNTKNHGLDSNSHVGVATSQSVQSEEVLYAAVTNSNIRKPEIHLQNEESCEYADIKWK